MKYNLNLFITVYISLILIYSIRCDKHTKEEWKSRAIYQILTDRFALSDDDSQATCDCSYYCNQTCGGTFNGIKNHLDYIKGMGFGAIWISPPLKNKPGSYHGYHNIDIDKINPNFGTDQELKDLITECHNNDIWVILDAVPNHMAGDLDISTFNPFNKTEHYHNLTDKDCEGHWDEQWYKENCRIWGMPDLNHENSFVNETIINWLKKMLKDYGFDGVRYADVVNAPTWFWNNLTYVVEGVYTLGIFDNQNVTYVASYQQYMDGVADFPLFYQLRSSFCDGSMLNLDNYIKTGHSQYTSPQYNVILFDIHDAERFLYQCSLGYRSKGLRNLVVFTFFFKGIPIFYYGDEQYLDSGGDFDKRRQPLFGNYDQESDLYQLIKTVNQIRKDYNIFDLDFTTKYVDADNYVYMRGNDIMIAVGKGLSRTIEIEDHGLNDDDKFCNKLKAGDCISVKDDVLTIRMDGEPKIYLRKSIGEMIYVSSYLFLFLILLALF